MGGQKKRRKPPKKYGIAFLRKIAKENGTECLSEAYYNLSREYNFKCNTCQHEWWTTVYWLLKGHFCPKCEGRKIFDIDLLKKIAIDKGATCLSTKYQNMDQYHLFKCKQGHKVWMRPCDLQRIRKTLICEKCVKTKNAQYENLSDIEQQECDLKLAELKTIAEEFGGKCLSKIFVKNSDEHSFRCKNKHAFKLSYSQIKRGKRCPICPPDPDDKKLGQGERKALSFISSATGCVFEKARPKWLKSPRGRVMEMDGYCESTGLAIEYQGQQHYKYIPLFHRDGPEDFAYQQERDHHKARLVAEHNILLLAVPASQKSDTASIREAVIKAAEDACFPLFGINREFTEMVLTRSRCFSACVLTEGFRLFCSHPKFQEKTKEKVLFDILNLEPMLIGTIAKAMADGHSVQIIQKALVGRLKEKPEIIKKHGGSTPLKIRLSEFRIGLKAVLEARLASIPPGEVKNRFIAALKRIGKHVNRLRHPPMHRFSACLPYAAFLACVGE